MQNPSPNDVVGAVNEDPRVVEGPLDAPPIGLQHDTRTIEPKTVTQHRNRFWTSTFSDDF